MAPCAFMDATANETNYTKDVKCARSKEKKRKKKKKSALTVFFGKLAFLRVLGSQS
jgi:hypothetical protein